MDCAIDAAGDMLLLLTVRSPACTCVIMCVYLCICVCLCVYECLCVHLRA